MRFNFLMFLLFSMMGLALYAIATGQTAASLCQDSGRNISSLADGAFADFGRAIEDTCTRR